LKKLGDIGKETVLRTSLKQNGRCAENTQTTLGEGKRSRDRLTWGRGKKKELEGGEWFVHLQRGLPY